ncbi:hypothetical protein PG993_005759 [Apiospora rasikravindrae]|uniref:Uncharacterized protein n=1 Tax=Apiospora rasikravindrae TaxID=990691 RepID=A0ABR1T9P8_9PEZI
MSDTPLYTKQFPAEHATHKRKHGRLVGRREMREKLVAGSTEAFDAFGGDNPDVECLDPKELEEPVELANRYPWFKMYYPYPLTQHKDPCWLYWCNVYARQGRRSRKEQVVEELEQGGPACAI